MYNQRKVILEPHKEKTNLWCWNVLQYSEKQDTWYSIGFWDRSKLGHSS